jgi:hypothetical protein
VHEFNELQCVEGIKHEYSTVQNCMSLSHITAATCTIVAVVVALAVLVYWNVVCGVSP